MMRALPIILVACGSSPATVLDAPRAIDATGDAGPCGADLSFTGELVDWDSTTAQFCGIFGATLQVHGDPSRVDHTPPNGRIQLCLASAPTTQIDITPPTAASECAIPKSTYAVPGILVANQAVIASGAVVSARSFTMARAPAFAFDSAKAQVFVHVDGTPRAVSITGTHDAAQAFDDSTWAAGSTGANVFFPNVDPTPGATSVDVAGGATGTGSVPISAGTFTYLTVVAN
jgi:hypothetical protein